MRTRTGSLFRFLFVFLLAFLVVPLLTAFAPAQPLPDPAPQPGPRRQHRGQPHDAPGVSVRRRDPDGPPLRSRRRGRRPLSPHLGILASRLARRQDPESLELPFSTRPGIFTPLIEPPNRGAPNSRLRRST
jgi:hypothetical protein